MPTVLRASGLRFVVYLNDHPPAHVHVMGPGWVVVVNLLGPEVREVVGAGPREAKRALDLVATHHSVLLDAWRGCHA